MPALPYYIEARDTAGVPLGGLKPSWQFLESPDRKPITPPPSIAEVEPGLYVTLIDPATTGEAVGRVDLGPKAAERYHTVAIYRTDAPPAPVVTPAAGPLTLDAATLDALGKAVAAHVVASATVTVPPETVQQIAAAVVAVLPVSAAGPTADQVAAAVAKLIPAPAPLPQATLDALAASVAAQVLAQLGSTLSGNPGKGKGK